MRYRINGTEVSKAEFIAELSKRHKYDGMADGQRLLRAKRFTQEALRLLREDAKHIPIRLAYPDLDGKVLTITVA